MASSRRGVALLEALVALVLLTTTGLGFVSLLRQTVAAEAEARDRERKYRAADRVLTAMTLLHRHELTQRIGSHPVGEFLVAVERPEATVFRVAVMEAAAPDLELLVTLVYRAASESAP